MTRGRPEAKKAKKTAEEQDGAELTARPRSVTLRPEGTVFEVGDSGDDDPVAVRTDHISPEDSLSAQQGLKWAYNELFDIIGPQLPGDSPQGLEELRRLSFEDASMEELLAEEGIHAGSSRSEMEDARDRIYQRRSRAVKRAVRKLQEYDDEGERYFLLSLMSRLRTKK